MKIHKTQKLSLVFLAVVAAFAMNGCSQCSSETNKEGGSGNMPAPEMAPPAPPAAAPAPEAAPPAPPAGGPEAAPQPPPPPPAEAPAPESPAPAGH